MEIRTTSLLFPETSGSGPISAEVELTFPRDVVRVTAGITGYTALFEDGDDHHVGRLEVETDARVDADDATKVLVTGRLGLRDWSNEFDDPYSGVVDVAVIAELEALTPPLPGDPRGDLVIVGAEITQAIQHFRSGDHLDAPNVFPDNSIRLIAGKPTVVRLYVDYDAASWLPAITTLSGSLVLFNPAGSLTLTPVETISPRRDASIDRGSRRHTLNFLIPDAESIGEVNLFATVADRFDPTQFSAPFERTIRFVQQPALRVLAVGIEYTGDDVRDDADPADLLAPTEADFVDTLEFTDRVYPIPGVMITDYRTMEYDEAVTSDISEGCDELGDLKDAVADFAGDSDDIVYGLFGTGLDTGSVGGCGGGGVGVGRVFAGGTMAHEIGHALGRQHAPCDNVTRCATPRNTDDNYPVYSGYDSDSVGEYGFDPTSMFGTVKDPSTAHDLMGYSSNAWISPYTYKALMSAIPGTTISSAAAALRAGERRSAAGTRRGDREWIPVKQPTLFLRLDIHRDGPVLHPSFHFESRPRIATGVATDYVLEQRDGEGRVLRRECLRSESSGCGCDGSFPVRIRQAVSFAARTSELVLFDCDDEVGRWHVPPPPDVEVECRPDDDDPNKMWLQWRVRAQQGPDTHQPDDESDERAEHQEHDDATDAERAPWSLVQWRDRSGTWRGISPRLRSSRLRVPRRLPAMSGVDYRVLVTTGIATGIGYCDEDCTDEPPPPPDRPEIVIVGTRQGAHAQELPRIVRGAVVGRGEHAGRIRWYDGSGGELGRGERLDMSCLRRGRNVVIARAVGADDPVPTGQWLIERTKDDLFVLRVGDDDARDDDEPRGEHDHGGHGHHRRGTGHHHHPHTHRDEGE